MSSQTKRHYNLSYASVMIRDGSPILDIRSTAEFKQGHVAGALHVNTRNTPELISSDYHRMLRKLKERISKYPESTIIVVYCRDGARATIAKSLLETLGYRNVALLGGIAIAPLYNIMQGTKTDPAIKPCKCILNSQDATLATKAAS